MPTLTSPITGAAQTGLTSPTYTHTVDTFPGANGKQVAVTALGGTQTGVTAHSTSSPFTLAWVKPLVTRFLGKPNPTTGLVKDVPRNSYKLITRKGVLPLAGQPYQVMTIVSTIDVPAGADLADAANVRAALSAHIGGLSQQSAAYGDTAITNVI